MKGIRELTFAYVKNGNAMRGMPALSVPMTVWGTNPHETTTFNAAEA
jgi:hypothetical protein